MQDSTIIWILGMIFFGSMAYVLIMVFVSLMIIKLINFEASIHSFSKRRQLKKVYIHEPITKNKKMKIVYRLNQVAGIEQIHLVMRYL